MTAFLDAFDSRMAAAIISAAGLGDSAQHADAVASSSAAMAPNLVVRFIPIPSSIVSRRLNSTGAFRQFLPGDFDREMAARHAVLDQLEEGGSVRPADNGLLMCLGQCARIPCTLAHLIVNQRVDSIQMDG